MHCANGRVPVSGSSTSPTRATCSEPTATSYYLPADPFELVAKDEAPDVFLGSSRWRCIDDLDGRVVHTVERMGFPLVTIKETGGTDSEPDTVQ